MVKYRAYIFICFSVLFVLSSCGTSTVEPDTGRMGYNYFPLEKGNFVIYDVEETAYALTANPVTRVYQIKEVVTEEFIDLSNEQAFKLMRYSRQNATADWALDSVWVAKRSIHQAVRMENNVSFVKMVFPVKENQKWNGNALNNMGSDEYQLSKVNKSFALRGNQFPSTATVTQINDSSACNVKRVYEVYGDAIGLVYKEKVLINFRQTNGICEGKGDIQDGIKSYQRLVNYGKE